MNLVLLPRLRWTQRLSSTPASAGPWGMGLHGVVTCFAIRTSDGFDSRIFHLVKEKSSEACDVHFH